MPTVIPLPPPPQLHSCDPFSIREISLYHFRNYQDLRLNIDARSVVLTGTNGSGKTNLLEALSLLVPGRGLRRASLSTMQDLHSTEAWAIAAKINTTNGLLTISTGRDPQTSEGERRIVHIDGKNVRNQNALAEQIAMAWITPEMDRILADSPSARRKLLGRLVYSFDPAHGGRIHRYDKALRERLRLLRDGIADATWLSVLEDEMAKTGVAIAAARKHMIQQLQAAMTENTGIFPRADIAIRGSAEEALETEAALLVEDRLRHALAQARSEDTQNGTCSIGPHRSDLIVMHRVKNCPANLCSTGEQKALLIAIMLAYIRTLIRNRSMTPLFLLDDIVAHLDDLRREALFDEILTLGVQAWFTGTDEEIFESLLPHAQHFVVKDGHIEDNTNRMFQSNGQKSLTDRLVTEDCRYVEIG
jgi:DNA replication and repair protein RecF